MADPVGPPEFVVLTIDEALDLLSALEDARSSFLETGLLSGAVLIEDPIRTLSLRLGFDDPGGDDER
jgi:hypothetical protein